MPITKSAKKALRQNKKRRQRNLRRLRIMREITKKIKKLVEQNKKAEAEKLLPQAYKAIDKATKAGIIKKNTAARKKSRLTKLVNKTGVSSLSKDNESKDSQPKVPKQP